MDNFKSLNLVFVLDGKIEKLAHFNFGGTTEFAVKVCGIVFEWLTLHDYSLKSVDNALNACGLTNENLFLGNFDNAVADFCCSLDLNNKQLQFNCLKKLSFKDILKNKQTLLQRIDVSQNMTYSDFCIFRKMMEYENFFDSKTFFFKDSDFLFKIV